ncbi:MAG TPA: adenylate cyclase [Marinilabiliales bacterium]|jgi:CYTH domain-containing protein|nr:CYTH domain-containing protein [Salinivirgaceae bacterium]OFX45200.1 MAG: adenylate cyclase [Bacteroidetes bacterium GWA2_40_14]OFX59051.1 MAG: adenylate cyclase [Bacteroidetes bacterium GWC2_40_13]OFX72235.1 MAG: adenylate cyclase [Bacteroidetes bacterium GWD2_40_43]OFX90518.1 MAG: adenylate cyclase [Bacteroidetes bacterium GWE2_40_63]OFY17237.1 MAG: adenylate cyclase [Bacteroidetes bacterium GWF2_40_13]OFZ26520.1 MAG: adenylate cyclase [Bacteroidetes bacterium RIFOXYC2_FULL_40_12]HAN007
MELFKNVFHKKTVHQAFEIERKFLVTYDVKPFAIGKIEIKQGYLSTDPARTVRIRITGTDAFITIKGASDETGTTRFEWESPIPMEEARSLLDLCLPHIIEKTRYIVELEDLVFEVDEFEGLNQGLVIAEVELTDPQQEIPIPEWLGEEVTNDTRYYNSYLSQHPFSTW